MNHKDLEVIAHEMLGGDLKKAFLNLAQKQKQKTVCCNCELKGSDLCEDCNI